MNLFLATYWKQISCAVAGLILFAYIALLKHENNSLERDNASLNATIEAISAQGKLQNEKADRIEEGSRKAAQIITDQYSSNLQKLKDYYAKHPTIKPVTHTVSVCESTTSDSTRKVSSENTSTERTDAGTADKRPSGQSIEQDCAETTLILLKLQDFERGQQEVSNAN